MSYSDFSSLPPEQEESFVIFEKTTRESAKKSKSIGIIAGVAFGVLTIVIAMAFKPPEKSHASEEEHSMGAEKSAPAAAAVKKEVAEPAAAEPAPAEPAQVEAAPTEAAPAEPAKEAPAPPPGATKAPPTALIGQ